MDETELRDQVDVYDARVAAASGNRKDKVYRVTWKPAHFHESEHPRKDHVRVWDGKVWSVQGGFDLVKPGEVWEDAASRLRSEGYTVEFSQECVVPDDGMPFDK